jgi:hypothetical protein
MASSVHNALRQFGQVLGVAVLGAIVYAHAGTDGGEGFVAGLHAAMWVSGTALLAGRGAGRGTAPSRCRDSCHHGPFGPAIDTATALR